MNNFGSMTGWNQPPQQQQQGVNLVPGTNVNDLYNFNAGRGSMPVGSPEDGGMPFFGEGEMGQFGLQAGQGIFNGWLGMQKLDLAKNELRENKRQFDMNWGAQKNLTNSRLEDRQRARNAANKGGHQSTDEYMSRHGVK